MAAPAAESKVEDELDAEILQVFACPLPLPSRPFLSLRFASLAYIPSCYVWPYVDPFPPQMSSEELRQRIRLLDNEIRIMKSDIQSIDADSESQRKRIKENLDKIKLNKQLPYLVGNVVEVLDMEDEEEEEEDGAAADVDAQRKGVSAVIKTSTRQTIFLPIPGLVDVKELQPGDLVGTNKVSGQAGRQAGREG